MRTSVGTASMCRVINGLWQTSGGWGKIDAGAAAEHMKRCAAAGFDTFDGADHYGPAEELMGRLQSDGVKGVFCTKWCPRPAHYTTAQVDQAVALARRSMQQIDLIAFHWWDYAMWRECCAAIAELNRLRERGLFGNLGVTNFNTERLRQLLEEEKLPIVSNQVSFSVVDHRPLARGMCRLCEQHGVKLLTYGTLLGGFLSDAFLGAAGPPAQLTTSQSKYLKWISAVFGTWSNFQAFLQMLRRVADGYEGASIAHLCSAWVLRQPAVGAVILGLRAGLTDHVEENRALFVLVERLKREHIDEIRAYVEKHGKPLPNDCGDEYRR